MRCKRKEIAGCSFLEMTLKRSLITYRDVTSPKTGDDSELRSLLRQAQIALCSEQNPKEMVEGKGMGQVQVEWT